MALRLGSVLVNREHDERRLHRHGRAVAAVNALDLAGGEAVHDVAGAGAAVAIDRRAEQAHGAHLGHDVAVKLFVAVRLDHAGQKALLAKVAHFVAEEALLLVERLVKLQRILPVKVHIGCGSGAPDIG